MLVFILTTTLMFGGVVHYADKDSFPNVPLGIWWALVTMTTVGYGDEFPKTFAGYVVGSFCVVSGVLVISFTVPIVVSNFAVYYTHAITRHKIKPSHAVTSHATGSI